MAATAQTTAKSKRDRSPAYPFISLKTAMERLAAFEKKFGRHPAPLDKAGLAWELKAESSQAAQTLSALKYFGLLEYTGKTAERAASMTEQARNYLRAQQASVKADLLKSFALRPKAMQTYWAKWNADRPIDEICLDELTLKDGFTESAAKIFLRVYDDSIAFAGLAMSDKMVATANDEEDEDADHQPPPSKESPPLVPPTPKVGDSVSWESSGSLMFESRRVLGLSPDGGFVFVEGSPTGLPLKEITVVAQASPTSQQTPPLAPQSKPPAYAPPFVGMKQDTFTLDEGPVILQWPASMSSTSYEDFNDWIELQLRKIKRSISQ